MQYVKGKPYFCDVQSRIKAYPYLDKDIDCDVLIIGGGINGAIANYYISKEYKCVLVEANRLGMSCTSCATALLEYQLDDFASDLEKYMTDSEIIDVYKAGLSAITKLENFVAQYGNHCEFKKKDTLVYSNKKKDINAFIEEYKFRQNAGLDVKYFDRDTNIFPFELECGIYCKGGGAECNPYLLEKQFIENAYNQDSIYENTAIVDVQKCKGGFIATTSYGEKIKTKRVVFATGFDYSLVTNGTLCDKFITYSIVTNVIKNIKWEHNALVQDYLDPYHYLRILPDNRIIYGGEDVTYNDKVIDDKKAKKKYAMLLKDLKAMLPQYADDINIDYSFCGIFGSTKNNLGYIGKGDEGYYYFYSCGANGIINAIFGIDTLLADFRNKTTKYTKLFSPLRIKK